MKSRKKSDMGRRALATPVLAGDAPGGGALSREALLEGTLHELDYEDVALSSAGLRLVRRAAASVLRRFSAVELEDLPLSRALALFLDRVFWEERSGGLILCADFPGQSFCLPIPRDCWGLRARFGPVQ